MWFELTVAILGMQKGAIVQLETDRNGVPLDEFWRRRYKDGDTMQKVEIPEKVIKIETKRRKR